MRNLLCVCEWQRVINAIPWLVAAAITSVLVLVGFYLYLKYWKQPAIKNAHENEMKKAASEREILWEILKKELKMEHESAVKNLEQKVNELEFAKKCKEKELESEKAIVEALKKETALYKEAFENINIEIRPKSNNK